MKYSKEDLIRYRIQRARESADDAALLVNEERWNAAANRLYYACFYIVSAYMALKGVKPATHAGLKSTFNRELVKTGKIDPAEGLLFNKLFSIRQQADYEDFVDVQPDEITPLLPRIREMIREIEGVIESETDG